MRLDITDERISLELLAQEMDWERIAGIIHKVDCAGNDDCVQWLIKKLGFPVRDETLRVISTLRGQEEPTPGVVIYGFGEEPCHVGFYDGKTVKSKWYTGPVYAHELEQVPLQWGNRAGFAGIQNLVQHMQAAMQGTHQLY